jgi:hypothetical protein
LFLLCVRKEKKKKAAVTVSRLSPPLGIPGARAQCSIDRSTSDGGGLGL